VKTNDIPFNMKNFIAEHHVLSLATSQDDNPSSCSVFYAFMPEDNCFIFASEYESEHIQNIMENADVSASIHDEKRDLMLIRGLQIKGVVTEGKPRHEHFYLKTFPEAEDIKKEVWVLKITELKLTDNKEIGFGQKEIWKY